MSLSLKQQLMDVLGLVEADFASHAGDLLVRDDPRVMPWLRNNYEFWTLAHRFSTTQPWSEGMLQIQRAG